MAYLQLEGHPWGGGAPELPFTPIEDIVPLGESDALEFKSTLAFNLHTQAQDTRMELMCLKSIAAFVNTKGGTLLIGVKDNGKALGLEEDKTIFKGEDGIGLHLVNLLRDRMSGAVVAAYVSFHFTDYDGQRILVVRCRKSLKPVYVQDNNLRRFYMRLGPSTKELSANDMVSYINQRFLF